MKDFDRFTSSADKDTQLLNALFSVKTEASLASAEILSLTLESLETHLWHTIKAWSAFVSFLIFSQITSDWSGLVFSKQEISL